MQEFQDILEPSEEVSEESSPAKGKGKQKGKRKSTALNPVLEEDVLGWITDGPSWKEWVNRGRFVLFLQRRVIEHVINLHSMLGSEGRR